MRGLRPIVAAFALAAGLCLGGVGGNANAARAGEAVTPQSASQMAAVPAVAARGQASVTDLRVGTHPDKTRFVVELTAAVPFQAFVDGTRVVVDLPDIAWKAQALPPGRGLVRGVRLERGAGRLRLVLDTAGAARIAASELIPPRDGRPPRLIVDLAPGGAPTAPHQTQASTVPLGRSGVALSVGLGAQAPQMPPDRAPAATATATGDRVSPIQTALAVPAAHRPAPSPPSGTSAEQSAVQPVSLPAIGAGPGAMPVPSRKPVPRAKPMVVIDAGHGGQDPGATSVNGMFEKDITLSVAREVRRQLQATGRFRAALTRDTDIFIPLRERVQIARDKGADLFISLHADSIGRPEVRGLSVYTLSDKASDREAEMLAQRENRSDAIVGMDLSAHNRQVATILIDLARRDTANQSRRFAGLIVDKADPSLEILPGPLRSAGFAVLTAPDIPSVLVEMGYLSHPKDAKLLVSAAHQKRLAAGMVRAIEAYFDRVGTANPS